MKKKFYLKNKIKNILKLAKYQYFDYDLPYVSHNIVKNIIYSYKTKYYEGFLESEIIVLLERFPTIKMDKFNNAMFGNTCIVIDEQIINHRHDIYAAIICGLENRELNGEEWD